MAFDEALLIAEKMGGQVVAFQQPFGKCAAFTARWLKYRILGRTNYFEHKQVFTTGFNNKEIEPDKKGDFPQAHLSSKGTEKFNKIYTKYENANHKSGDWTINYLKNSKGVSQNYASVQCKIHDRGNLDKVLVRKATSQNYRACHCSLQPGNERTSNSGWNTNAIAAGTADNHSIGFFNDNGQISFFDPNMGEVTLPKSNFEIWWTELFKLWKQDKLYVQYRTFVLTEVRTPEKVDESFALIDSLLDDW